MSPPTPDPPHPPLHFSDAQIVQWRRGWKVLLRSRTKKKETDPLNEEQRQRKLQKGQAALQRFHDKQHAMVSTAPGLPRPADTVAEPSLLTPPPVRRCQPPATFDGASPEGSLDSLNTPPTVSRRKSFATYDDVLHEGLLVSLKACALTRLRLGHCNYVDHNDSKNRNR